MEAATVASFKLFRRYFQHFLAVVPKLVTKGFSTRVIFRVYDRDGFRYWLVDLRRRTVEEVDHAEPCDIRIDVDALVLNDCVRKRMFSRWGPSKRLKIVLYEDSTYTTAATFFMLLDAYENDVFPVLTWRHLRVGVRRWRELVEFGRLFGRHKRRRKPFIVKDLYPLCRDKS